MASGNMATGFLSIFTGGILGIAGITGSSIHSVVQGQPDGSNKGSSGPTVSGETSQPGSVTRHGKKLTGKVRKGKISWFGGPKDPSSSTHTASGISLTQPGVAVNNQNTLGGWWRVRMPNGTVAVLQQTDIGPATWTGRFMDFTYSALHSLGYSENNFPTDSEIEAEYLGKKRP